MCTWAVLPVYSIVIYVRGIGHMADRARHVAGSTNQGSSVRDEKGDDIN
jgi:hypothetical protein